MAYGHRQGILNSVATGCATAFFAVGVGSYLHVTDIGGYVSQPTASGLFTICDGVTSSALFSINGATYTSFLQNLGTTGLRLGSAGNSLLLKNNSSGTAQFWVIGYEV
jgi:hypothetical protein